MFRVCKEIIMAMSNINNRGAVMSQAPSSNFDWSKHVISSAELNEYYGEIDFCQSLREKTMTCGDCGQRNRFVTRVMKIH